MAVMTPSSLAAGHWVTIRGRPVFIKGAGGGGTAEDVITNPGSKELHRLLNHDPDHYVRGVLDGDRLHIAGDQLTHEGIALRAGVPYDMKNRIVFYKDKAGHVHMSYEADAVGTLYKSKAIQRLGFDPRDDIQGPSNGKRYPVQYDPTKHDFSKATDYSDIQTMRWAIGEGKHTEGAVLTDGLWLYEVKNKQPERVRGVTADYAYGAGTYGPVRRNFG